MVVLLSYVAITQSYPSTTKVKFAKSAAVVMIKGGVKPNVSSYHSNTSRLYKRGSRSVVKIKIKQKMDELLVAEHYNLVMNEYD